MIIDKISLAASPLVKPLIKNYLEGQPSTEPLYDFAPNFNGLQEALLKRKSSSSIPRNLLVSSLHSQYKQCNILHSITNAQIDALAHTNSFTITTGHQLNLLGGTQYFIYKIVETILTAQKLASASKELKIIPVFWMASEDHDFEEINHFYLKEIRHTWHKEVKGATGKVNPSEVLDLLNGIKSFFDEEPVTGKYLFDLFSKAYALPTLAMATRFWVHELFKDQGLVIIDGDDAQLKQSFIPVAKRELFEEVSNIAIEKTNAYLKANHFHIQAHSRQLNLFYFYENQRLRIVKNENAFEVLETDLQFTSEQIIRELEQKPESFSPNAFLRPVYQESILPNLAYVGGTGEMAYWLQLKSTFDEFGVFFPQLIIRNSVIWIPKRWVKKAASLPIQLPDFLQRKEKVIQQFAEQQPDIQELIDISQKITKKLADLKRLGDEAPSEIKILSGKMVSAQKKLLKKYKHDLRKAIKNKEKLQLKRLETLYDLCYPMGVFQERINTFIPSYMAIGNEYFKHLFKHLEPHGAQVLWLAE